jgi:predicted glycosyltransferase
VVSTLHLAAELSHHNSCIVVVSIDATWPDIAEDIFDYQTALQNPTAWSGAIKYINVPIEATDPISLREKAQKLWKIHEIFQPDLVVVEHQPAGRAGCVKHLIENTTAEKYLLLRGVMGAPDLHKQFFFSHDGERLLRTSYDRILIKSDERTATTCAELQFDADLLKKTQYVGYMARRPRKEELVETRRQRNIPDDAIWVACSLGSGYKSSFDIDDILDFCASNPDFHFDIVTGPKFPCQELPAHRFGERVIVRPLHKSLSAVHSSCDALITHGGLNSLLEGLLGGAAVFVDVSMSQDPIATDEREQHALMLSRYCPVSVLRDRKLLLEAVGRLRTKPRVKEKFELNVDGAHTVASLIQSEFPQ